ncbi:DUF7553 family protein [Natronococcus jeotgali]|uniref:Uncharacterized protein n=1 Tax=Natronococcus jeotgali DSM 18795 TaxID=1227498 RepID=L9XSJ0_9EURY|nr:hypothetical protein [Natronococcus jeotgali]ELY64774.1 hypothetical protein C492_04560 [Natronococcus jeotgali DSM 18795]
MAQELKQVRDELEQAAKVTDDDGLRDDIHEHVDAFEDYTVGDQNPDHALMDEHLNGMRQLSDRAENDTKDHLDSALETAEEYREGIDQA